MTWALPLAKSPSPTPTPSESGSAPPVDVVETVSWWTNWLLSDAPLRLLGIVLFAVVAQTISSFLIRRVVKRAVTGGSGTQRRTEPLIGTPPAGVQTERRKQRAHAIGQLVRSVLAVVIWGSALMMALPVFGIDITPLLASAGVVGVAGLRRANLGQGLSVGHLHDLGGPVRSR